MTFLINKIIHNNHGWLPDWLTDCDRLSDWLGLTDRMGLTVWMTDWDYWYLANVAVLYFFFWVINTVYNYLLFKYWLLYFYYIKTITVTKTDWMTERDWLTNRTDWLTNGADWPIGLNNRMGLTWLVDWLLANEFGFYLTGSCTNNNGAHCKGLWPVDWRTRWHDWLGD